MVERKDRNSLSATYLTMSRGKSLRITSSNVGTSNVRMSSFPMVDHVVLASFDITRPRMPNPPSIHSMESNSKAGRWKYVLITKHDGSIRGSVTANEVNDIVAVAVV